MLNASIVMLLIDRQLDAHFFLPSGGGSALLWQHFFWTFGHPEVYIMALPAFGMISEIIPVFSRKPIFGYEFVAGSTVAIAILSFGVWAHHMFAVGLGHTADLFFAAGSMLIAVPTGVKIFNWVATMWGGSIRLTTAMCFAVAFLLQFVVGGLSGVTFAVAPIDWQMTDTYYVVAHFHYVLFGGTAFALFSAAYYWFPKMSGRMLSERIGRAHFWLMVVGFNLTFFVQHFLGFAGMPRRVYTYPDIPTWGALNLVSTVGAFVMGLGALVFVYNIVRSLRAGERATDNPWDAWTLEWATTSPPPAHNFDAIPPIRGRRPLWDLSRSVTMGDPAGVPQTPPVTMGNPVGVPQTPPVTMGNPVGVPQTPPVTMGDPGSETAEAPPAEPEGAPVGDAREPSLDKDKVGVGAFVVSEAGFFLILIIAYVFFGRVGQAGPSAASALDVQRTGVYTALLLASSVTLWRAEKAGTGSVRRAFLALTVALGAVFMIGQGREYAELFARHVTVSTNLFATSFFTLTGFHGLHVTLGLVALLVVLSLAVRDGARKEEAVGRSRALEAIAVYWHFVDVVWLVVFAVVYLRVLS